MSWTGLPGRVRRARTPSARHARSSWSAIALMTLVLAYGGGLWIHLLHEASGAHEPGAPHTLLHWLRDSTLLVPVVFVAVALGLAAARRIVRPFEAGTGAVAWMAIAGSIALATSAAEGLAIPLHGMLFAGGHLHEELTLAGHAQHMVVDGLQALTANLALSVVLVDRLRGALWTEGSGAAGMAAFCRPVALRRVAAAAFAALIVVGSSATPPAVPPAAAAETGVCPATAPLKTFAVSAIDVRMWLDRFGTSDPNAQMYVLDEVIPAVRAQEAAGRTSLSLGLRDDPLQPLAIRANQGDCVVITFTNRTTRPAPQATDNVYGIHIQGLVFDMASSGDAVGGNAPSHAEPGQTVTYRYFIPDDRTLEGAHEIQPGPGNRQAIAHGLFGTLVVEPPGSVYLNMTTGEPLRSGWEAIIVPAEGKAFRENVKVLHEIGNESEVDDVGGVPVDADGVTLKTIDPHTGAYRPGSRAINYRSEPFMDRLDSAPDQKSAAYSSYTFGDTPNIIARGYVGDPTKFRVVHAGSEVFHVYHLHGGSIRWRFDPVADPTFDYGRTGIYKRPVEVHGESARLDSQTLGPGEAYSMEIENGAGGAQQGAGEFLFHCHIAHHYVAGMWGMWRVYDTLQPDLAPLPDRQPLPKPVDSAGLVGRTIDGQTVTAANLDAWIRPQLPVQGVTRATNLATRDTADQDASVWDWRVDPLTGLYLGEPDRAATVRDGPLEGQPWPNFENRVPGRPAALVVDQVVESSYLVDGGRVLFDAGGYVGNRPKLLFNPSNGRPAFPLLRPHIGKRAPFAPNLHSGAPYLGEAAEKPIDTSLPIDPWAGRADGICPSWSPVRSFNVVGIEKAIAVTDPAKTAKVVDLGGALFVLAEDKEAVYAGTKAYAGEVRDEPLTFRGNIGDCIALTYTSELTDGGPELPYSKTNIHVHHVQFDTQGSDGVNAGYTFEGSIRPYKVVDPQLTAAVGAGATVLPLTSVAKFQPGVAIGVGLGTDGIEIRTITAIDAAAGTVTLDRPLERGHAAGEWAGVEFVQYRWYPDVALDNVFFHDHVNGIHGWSHGLMGQFVVEPAGARYFDPVSGEEIRAGARADIHLDPACVPRTTPSRLPPDTSNQCALIPGVVEGAYREFALATINNHEPLTADATINLRAELWTDRPCADPARRFTSACGGDPYTPIYSAYVGDPVVVRHLEVGQGTNSLTIDGHRTFLEPRFRDADGISSSPVSSVHAGVSERFTLVLDGGAGGPNHLPGDYLYHDGIDRRFQSGGWGIMRVLGNLDPAVLRPLPGRTSLPQARATCPAGAPVRSFAISAIDLRNGTDGSGDDGREAAFVPTARANAIRNSRTLPDPLVLHVAAGECVEVTLRNQRATARASFHVDGLLRDGASSGVNVGRNEGDQTVAPGGTRTYRFFADTEKLQSVLVSDFGADGGRDGLYGSIVVAPAGASFTNPTTGEAADIGPQVDVHVPGRPSYRDFTLLLTDGDGRIGQDTMPYPRDVDGPALVNYRQVTGRPQNAATFSSDVHGDPVTPLLRAYAGDPVKVHVLVTPGSEQPHVFGLGGMRWPQDPYITGSSRLEARAIAPWSKIDLWVAGGAGGTSQQPGDYFYGDRRRPFTEAGQWGIFRVLPASCPTPGPAGPVCLPGQVVLAPAITSVTPASGPTAGGTAVTITGERFGTAPTVTFGGLAAGVTSTSDTSIVAVAPAHAAGAVDVVVTAAGGIGTAVGAYTYESPPPPPDGPTITSLSPTSGPTAGGTAVTISGERFGTAPTVTFGGLAAAVTAASATSIAVVTPAHAAGAVDVVVTTAAGSATAAGAYTYVAPPPPPGDAPTITSLKPTSGKSTGGTNVTITGTGFRAGMTVTFGGVPGLKVQVKSATKVMVQAPAHPVGVVDVVVTAPNGASATARSAFTYVKSEGKP